MPDSFFELTEENMQRVKPRVVKWIDDRIAAHNISSNIVGDTLPPMIAFLNRAQTFSFLQTLSAGLNVAGGNVAVGSPPGGPVEQVHVYGSNTSEGTLKVEGNRSGVLGAQIILQRTGSNVDGNVGGNLRVFSKNSSDADTIVTEIYFTIEETAAGGERGGIWFDNQEAGADVIPLRLIGDCIGMFPNATPAPYSDFGAGHGVIAIGKMTTDPTSSFTDGVILGVKDFAAGDARLYARYEAMSTVSPIAVLGLAQTWSAKQRYDDPQEWQEESTPASPSSGYRKIYLKSNGKLYQLDSGGTESEIGSGSGGGLTRVVDVSTTQLGNTAATETDLFSTSITLLANEDSIEFEAAGTFATSVTTDKRIKVKIGSTTILDTGALAITSTADWIVKGRIVRTGASTQKCYTEIETSSSVLVSTVDYVSGSESMTAVTLKITGQGTNANDVVGESWVVLDDPASGVSGSVKKIDEKTASSSATLDFTDLSSTYREYLFVIQGIEPATNNVAFHVLLSTNNGSSFLGSAYRYHSPALKTNSGSYAANASASDSKILLVTGLTNGANYGINGELRLTAHAGSKVKSGVIYHVSAVDTGGEYINCPGSGGNDTTTAINAIRFLFSSGNIAAGKISLYGVL